MVESENRVERALRLFEDGCSCSQAVFAAFSDIAGLDEKQAVRLSSSFGGGMCGMRETCGAVAGMLMAVGAICGYDDTHDAKLKADHYNTARALVERFVQENGTVICRELLEKRVPQLQSQPIEMANGELAKRPCAAFVAQAARLAEALLDKSRLIESERNTQNA